MSEVGKKAQGAGRTKGLGPLLAVNFAGSLGYTIVMPFLVFLVMQWGGDAIVFGLVSAAYSAFQLVGAPVLVAAAVSLGATILISVGLPKSNPVAPEPETSKPDSPESSHAAPGTPAALVRAHGLCPEAPRPVEFSTSEALRIPRIRGLLSACFLVSLAFSFFYIALPVHAAQDLHWSPKETGWFFALMSLAMVIVEGPVLRRASRVCSDAVLIAVGGLVLGVSFLFLIGDSDPMMFGGAILIAVGNGLMWPLIIALLSEKAGDHQGVVQGLAGSSGAVASIIGLILGGVLYGHLGVWLFVISAGLAFLVMLMALWARRSS